MLLRNHATVHAGSMLADNPASLSRTLKATRPIRMSDDGSTSVRTAILSFVALQSAVRLVGSDLPGLGVADPPVLATAINVGFLCYCGSTIAEQARGRQALEAPTLEGLTAVLRLDIGREPGTWMPSEWGASGARLSLPITVNFTDETVDLGFGGEENLNGRFAKRVRCIEPGRFISAELGERVVDVREGAWVATPSKVGGVGKVRFFLEIPHSVTRNDVTLPSGRIFFSGALLGAEADPRTRIAEISDGAFETPSGALLVAEGGLTVKRNDARNLWGALGETNLILGRFAFTRDWSRDGAEQYGYASGDESID